VTLLRVQPRQAPEVTPDAANGSASMLQNTTILRFAGAIVGQTALLTALLLYFGWARTRTTYSYFGVDLSLLDLSTTDYVLRSVNSAYRPLLWLGLLVLAAFVLHRYLPTTGGKWVVVVGGVLAGIGVIALLWGDWSRQIGAWIPDSSAIGFAWLPVVLASGFALLAYGALQQAPGGSPQLVAVFIALFLMALFWTVSLVAVHDGRMRAEEIARNLDSSPGVTVFSPEVLAIRGYGVAPTPLKKGDADPGRYTIRYDGLRLLIHTDGKYFLLPVGWKRGRDPVIELPDDGQIRIELTAN
jgi:hypothetical protein